MGFRFSRRVSILPGLKLNFSGSGVSLSAGIPGAHVNLGSRGTYASVGIPGTGISYRQRVGDGRPTPAHLTEDQVTTIGDRQNDGMAEKLFHEGTQDLSLSPDDARRYVADPRFKLMDPDTGLRLSAARLEAKIKADELKAKIENIQVELEQEADEYEHLLNFWKPLPEIASFEEWKAAQIQRPFESKLTAPEPPDFGKAQTELLNELTARQATSGLNRFLPGFVARNAAEKELETAWPERQTQLQGEYERQFQQYQQQLAAETAAWDEAEAKRIAWVARLLAGDLEEVHHTMSELLEGLRFPFRTHCDYFLKDEQTVYLHLDLPEIEEVIPETRKEMFKNGETREVRRSKGERGTDYRQLVIGESVFLAAEVFSYLPLARVVQVAAYTQIPKERETDPIDSYLLDVPFQRSAVIAFGQAEENLVAFVGRQGGRLRQNDDGGLERIAPPAWLEHADVQKALAQLSGTGN